jgi:hypothetical protein
MGINRVAAIDYARRFWNRPSDDGVFWLSNQAVVVEQKRRELGAPARDGWEALFVSDGRGGEQAVFQRTVGGVIETKLIQPWEGLADCAHFLSKCLQAGGININERGVPQLVSALQTRSDTKTLAEKIPKGQGQLIVNTGIFKQGDMIGYFNVDPAGDYGGARNYSHSTMYAGKPNAGDPGRVTCHTISRFPGLSFVADEWFLHSGYTYTFIHFSSDDPPLNMVMAASLAGWWKVEYGARTEYYYIFRDGRARYTLRAPRSNQELHAADGSAYWFQQLNKITFIWRKTGTIEVWTPGGNAREFRILVNSTPGKSTKLF